jgi:hypothetical protein
VITFISARCSISFVFSFMGHGASSHGTCIYDDLPIYPVRIGEKRNQSDVDMVDIEV